MIINLEDCPFEFGEKIYFYKEERKYKTIPCPFCNGKQILNLDVEGYVSDNYKNANLNKEYKTGIALKCKNCTDGTYTYCNDVVRTKEYGVIKSILAYHSTGWRFFEFCIKLDDGSYRNVTGRDLHKISAEEISVDKIIEKSPIVELIKLTRTKIENDRLS